ncbi:MAG TPA: flagellar biosynthetic protein FliO [Verrucomicrobiae bacterium]|nr:flagellar biosynthetic protein FliO [Verrucomicrobiae bacterium]
MNRSAWIGGILAATMAWDRPTLVWAEAVNSPGPTPLPDLGVSVLRVFGGLVLVLALFLGGVWLFKNSQKALGRTNGVNKLRVVEVKSLGNRQSICVVGYGRQRMLVGASPAGVSLVSQLPEASPEEETSTATPSFADALQSVLQRKS